MLDAQKAPLQTSDPSPQTEAPEAGKHPTSVASANLSSVGILLVSVVLSAVGQLVFKAALNDIGELTLSVQMIIDLVTSPVMLLGLGIFGFSAFLWLIALMKADLSFAYPFLSLAYVLILLGGAVFFDDSITVTRIAGVILIIGGLLVVARSEK